MGVREKYNNDSKLSPPSWREDRKFIKNKDHDIHKEEERLEPESQSLILADEFYIVRFKSGTNSKERDSYISEGETRLGAEFTPKAKTCPYLWSEREDDYTGSPIDWIKDHYGEISYNGTWVNSSNIRRKDLRIMDFPLYQAFNNQVSRLRKFGKPIPQGFEELAAQPSERVTAELAEAGIEDPKDAYKKFPDDRAKADRLYQAAVVRQGPK